tara:strand:- start:1856 stop:2899 length:1044 start_codon:yes stop_codon:yes gene_type:complete
MKILALIVAGSKRQHDCILKSISKAESGINYDLLYITRNFNYFPRELEPKNIGKILFENKVMPDLEKRKFLLIKKENELKHKAFGAYKYYSYKYYKDYDYIICISDDVYIRRNNWLKDIIKLFKRSNKIGLISNQIRNSPRHVRAPFIAFSSECLSVLDKKDIWIFDSDHDGEQRIGEQVAEAGFLCVQMGHLFDLCTDYEWNNRGSEFRFVATPYPYHIFEKKLTGNKSEDKIYSKDEINKIEEKIGSPSQMKNTSECISDESLGETDLYQRWNIFYELQPFNNLIHNAGQNIAFKNDLINSFVCPENDFLKNCGWLYKNQRKNFNFGRYFSPGVDRFNPIITILD